MEAEKKTTWSVLDAYLARRREKKLAAKRASLGFWRENIEALTVAIIMAIVIKQFAFEAYQVPTESMEPTIIGRAEGGHRIIVNKFVYLLRDPRRWEVVVFQYPHNRLVNYVKRAVGMPDEWLFIRNGDIYTADSGLSREEALKQATIQRKPDGIQEALFDLSNCIPPGDRGVDKFRRYWVEEKDARGRGTLSAKAEDDVVVFRAEEGATLVRFTRPADQLERRAYGADEVREVPVINDRRYDDWGPEAGQGGSGLLHMLGVPYPASGRAPEPGYEAEVGDVRMRFEVQPSAAEGEVAVEIRDGTHPHPIVVRIGVDGSGKESRFVFGSEAPVALDVTVPPEEWTEVEVVNVDDQVVIRVDGEEVHRHTYRHEPIPVVDPVLGGGPTTAPYNPYDPGAPRPAPAPVQKTHALPYENAVFFGFSGGRAEFREIELSRDTYYGYAANGASDFKIPPESYLPLGDNSANSLDGRAWKVSRLKLRVEDGDPYASMAEDGALVLEGDAEGVTADESKPRPMVNPYDGETKFIDVHGNTWDIDPERIIRPEPADGGHAPAAEIFFGHFVPREYILGRAYVTFWPPLQIGTIR